MRRGKHAKPVKFSKVVVAAVLVSVLVFTVAMVLVFLRTGAVPDTLVASFFAFAGGEAGVLGVIRYGDAKFEKGNDEEPKG